jgi:hypothetical protein
VGKWQMDGKEQPFFLHTFVTPLAILVTLLAGLHMLGKDTKAILPLDLGQRVESYEGIVKEDARRCRDSDVTQKVNFIINCTVVGYLDHNLLRSILISNILLPFLVFWHCSDLPKPRIPMVNPGKFASRIGHR